MSLEDVVSIKIKGGFFEQEEVLNLFLNNNKNHRFCVLYGKNGSGKTTISRAFSKLSGASENTISEVSVLDKDNKVIDITSISNAKIQVFNEDFIKRNIQIEGDGLDSIVVMGEKKEIDDRIKELRAKLEEVNKKYENQIAECNKLENNKNLLSPEYFSNKMMEALKGNGNWAERDRIIHGTKINTSVNKTTFKKFKDLKTDKSRDNLIIEFNELNNKLIYAKNGNTTINSKIVIPPNIYDIEDTVRNILNEKIEKPELNEREEFLFSLLEKHEQHEEWLENIKNYFSLDGSVKCPYCCQPVKSEYAKNLVKSIEKILSKKVEEHKEKLNNLHRSVLNTSLEQYSLLNNKQLISNILKAEKILNEAINILNDFLNKKESNVYIPINLPKLDLKIKYDNYIITLKQLEIEIIEYNKKITDEKSIIKDLEEINSLIAMYDIKPFYESYEQQLNYKANQDTILKQILAEKNIIEEQLKTLEQEKKNAKIAMDSINANLKYIFFSNNRLYINFENENNRYILYSNGKRVKPENVSVGERNAIALCYFFNQIMKDKEEKEVYTLPYLIVIDDPISSFDMENRIGIMSYLKYMISKFAIGNKSSKFFIMTHDFQVLFDLYKLIKEISDKAVESFKSFKDYNGFDIINLLNKKTKSIEIKKRNEYSELLEQIYNYANSVNIDNSNNIGNIMRKALEAFSTFSYKKGIEEISTNTKILGKLEEPYRSHFENLMYRLVLHGCSHMEEKVKTVNDLNFFDFISDSEKQLTAKNILCFIYMLNSLHLLFHFGDKANEVERNIKKWCNEIIAS